MNGSGARKREHTAIVLLLLLGGLVLRLYFVEQHSSFMQSDEAFVGLEATHILSRGHLPIFDYGEARGGALFMYAVAPFLYLFGASNTVFKVVEAVFSVLFVYLVYLLARRVGGGRVGLIALALAAFGPPFLFMWSVHGAAEYVVLLLCGAGALLLGDDILFGRGLNRPPPSRARLLLTYGLMGLVMGIGVWAIPLYLSFLAAVWLVLFVQDRKCFFRSTFVLFLAGFLLANVPAIIFNVRLDLRAASGLEGTPNWISYTELFAGAEGSLWETVAVLPGTLVDVARVSLPVMLGGSNWAYETGWARRATVVLLLAFWIAAIAYTFWDRARRWRQERGTRRWPVASIDAPLLVFLLSFAIFVLSPRRYLVTEPRYLLPMFTFLPIAGACFVEWILSHRRVLGYGVLALVLVLNVGSTIWFSPSVDLDHALWPEDKGLQAFLVENEIEHPITDFWLTYSMAFATGEKVIPVPISYFKFGYYEDVLEKPLSTYYIFPKRDRDDRLFNMFRWAPIGKEWSALEFNEYLGDLSVPEGAYRSWEFEHYVLFDVPRVYVFPEVVASAVDALPEEPAAVASRILADEMWPGDALVVNPPGLVQSLDAGGLPGVAIYALPDPASAGADSVAESLEAITSDAGTLFALFGDTDESDPEGWVEGWLNRNAYPAGDRWIGGLRLVVYGTAAAQLAPARPAAAGAALFGQGIELAGSDLPGGPFRPGSVVPLTLFWQARAPVAGDLTVFVHLVDPSGQVVAQRDSAPVSGLQPASAWTEGVEVVDRHGILLPGDLPAGEYRLLIGLYDPASGARLPVESEDGVALEGALPLGTVTVAP